MALSARGVVVQFPGVRALDDARLDLRPGEIHALMGENGAGKSTLIKVVSGVQPPDAAALTVNGHAYAPRSVENAEAEGVSTVFQEVHLATMRSVAENLFVGRYPKRFGVIRWAEVRRQATAWLAEMGLKIDVTRPVGTYALAVQQMVAICRAVHAGTPERPTRVLILDEPTSSLDAEEAERLFVILRRLRERGLAVLFVTHFIGQVYAVCDRITVMRNGRFVGEWATGDLPRAKLIGAMVGRDIDAGHAAPPAASTDTTDTGRAPPLRVNGLGRRGVLTPTSFGIAAGEIVGLAGLLGSGRTELAGLVFGVQKADSGDVSVDGQPHRFASPAAAMRHGLAMLTEDRKHSGIAPNLSVRENMILALQSRRGLLRAVPRAEQEKLADEFVRELAIKTPSPEQPIRLLSGGNQQKVLLARWLITRPRLLILDEPTRGIDIGAKAEVMRLVRRLSGTGMGVLFISAELEEVAAVCRHVLVLRDRQVVDELRGDAVSETAIYRSIAAHTHEHGEAP